MFLKLLHGESRNKRHCFIEDEWVDPILTDWFDRKVQSNHQHEGVVLLPANQSNDTYWSVVIQYRHASQENRGSSQPPIDCTKWIVCPFRWTIEIQKWKIQFRMNLWMAPKGWPFWYSIETIIMPTSPNSRLVEGGLCEEPGILEHPPCCCLEIHLQSGSIFHIRKCIRIDFLKNISPMLEKNWEEKLPISPPTLDMSLKCSTRPSYLRFFRVPEAMSCTRPASTPSTLTFPLRPAVDSCAAAKDLPSRNLLRDIVGKPCWPSRCAMFHATNATTPPSSPFTFAMKRAELLEQAAMLRYEVPL